MEVVSSRDIDYGRALAMVEAGEAQLLGERYDEDGSKLILVGTGARPNASVRIGREFFTTALKDYEDWQEKWWREGIQNAVDAGATRITCFARSTSAEGHSIDVQGHEQQSYFAPGIGVTISIEDDGGGMSEEVLLEKFLVLGGTTKAGIAGSTGGFGKAKELLILPWLDWEIHTRDRIVRGSGIEYEVSEAPFLHGTKLKVTMPTDQCTHQAAALAFIGKCDLPGIDFEVNGRKTKANLRVGEQVRTFDDERGPAAALFHDARKPAAFQALLVRVNGLFMFTRYVPHAVKGQIIVEVLRPSVEVLTANRDGFRERDLRYGIENFVTQLSADTSAALRKSKGLLREKFRGSGKFIAASKRELESSLLDAVHSYEPRAKLAPRDIARVEEILRKLSGAPDFDPDAPSMAATYAGQTMAHAESAEQNLNFRASSDIAHAMLDELPIAGATFLQAMVKQLAWEPDFFVINEVDDFKVPKKFFPATMTPAIRKLARFWAELCRFVLIQLGSDEPFGVGFIFERDIGAQYSSEDNEHWLMLNPLVKAGRHSSGSDWPQDADMLSLADEDDVKWLYAAAVHECTHMADGITYHDESFAAALTRNFAKTAGRDRQLRAIRKAVVARGSRTER